MTTSVNPRIQQIEDHLHLISLPVPITGFDGFIGAWVYSGGPVVLIDVGPAVSAPLLLSALADLDLGAPDLILLTHIHIDHAGGIGLITNAFPKAKVVCHPKGAAHLSAPDRLWQGSLKTLGDIARAYEPIVPAAPQQVIASDHFNHEAVACLETPGHAAHHLSFLIGDLLFAGEAGGVCLSSADQTPYLRPATPPRFFMETSLESIDRLIARAPEKICYGHIGKRGHAVKMLRAHREQLIRWHGMIQPFFQQSKDEASSIQACVDHLLTNDPLLTGFGDLTPSIQQRERYFLTNSIKGYWGYLKS